MPPDLPAGPENFRSRVAAEKRERTRARLLSATLEAYLASEAGSKPVIDDVIRLAGVSRGTFYKYFDSLDELLPELGQQMAEDMFAAWRDVFGEVADAGLRLAGGPLLTLARAAMQPGHVALTSRMDFARYFARDDLHGATVKTCLVDGLEAGLVRFHSLDTALDYTVGATMEGARRVLRDGRLDRARASELTVMILRGLGMRGPVADKAARLAWDRIASRATALPWWNESVLA